MSCAYDKERLTGYYDGELAPSDKVEVEKHISACSECLRDLGEIKSSALLVKELPRLRAPASIAQAVAREIRPAGRLHSLEKWRKGMFWGVSAAAALLVVVNVVYFTGDPKEADPVARSGDPGLGWTAPLPKASPADETANRSRGAQDHAEREKKATFGDSQRRSLDEAARKVVKNETADEDLKKLEKDVASASKKGAEDGKLREEAAKAAPAPPPAAAPAPKPQAPKELLAREPKPEASLEAKRPIAPAAPAPVPGEARKDARDRALAAGEEQKPGLRQGALEPAKGKDAGPGAPALTCLLVTASDAAATRRTAQEFGQARSETGGLSYSVHGTQRGTAGAPEPVELFLTDRQIEELKQTLAAQQAAVLAVATPEEAGAMCVTRVQQQAGDKALAGAAGGRAPAGPADPGVPAKKPSEPAKPAAENASKEAGAPQLEKAEAERSKADAPVAGAKSEPRRRVLLYFRAALPGEVVPPAAEKKK